MEQKPEYEKVLTTKIPFEGVSQDVLSRLAGVLDKMAHLHEEINSKRNQVVRWNKEFDELARALAKSEFHVDDGHLSESIDSYSKLLGKVLLEIRGEIALFSRYLEKEPPQEIEVVGGEIELDASLLLERKIASMAKNVKVMGRDLQVSFSRYEHGLGGQLKQLRLAKKGLYDRTAGK